MRLRLIFIRYGIGYFLPRFSLHSLQIVGGVSLWFARAIIATQFFAASRFRMRKSVISLHLLQITNCYDVSFNITMDPNNNLNTLATCTTCTYKEDTSNYWTAVLYFKHPNGTFKRVRLKALYSCFVTADTIVSIRFPKRRDSSLEPLMVVWQCTTFLHTMVRKWLPSRRYELIYPALPQSYCRFLGFPNDRRRCSDALNESKLNWGKGSQF